MSSGSRAEDVYFLSEFIPHFLSVMDTDGDNSQKEGSDLLVAVADGLSELLPIFP